jgi:hypothetical protein
LSSPEPSDQLIRLKLLYKDIHTAIVPLLPAAHPVLVTLSSQLSPTSAPLHSAVMHLREVLSSLRERCAPARDAYIDGLLQKLQDPPAALPDPSPLAKLVVNTTESVLKLSDTMKDDLSQFVLGAMSEKQLQVVIKQQARRDERRTVLQLYPLERTQHLWTQWLSELSQESSHLIPSTKWIPRLMQALGSTIPVSSTLPVVLGQLWSDQAGSDSNSLPPPLLFSGTELLYIQNFLQAVVIAASLRSLARLPSPTSPSLSSSVQGGGDFMERVWTLLRAEVDQEEGSGDTKVVNLADEVLRAQNQGMVAKGDRAEETRLRAAVQRTLHPSDPVFILLQKRLLTALTTRMSQRDNSGSLSPRIVGPEHMHTGFDREGPGKRPRLRLDSQELGLGQFSTSARGGELRVKGFEDPVLMKAIKEVLGRLMGTVEWVESVWKDVIDGGSDT